MGRRPKPAEIAEAQGNPGRRRIHKVTVEPAKAPGVFPFAVSADARLVYDLVAPELKRMNILRGTDEAAFWRYCDTMGRYWRVTQYLNKSGNTYRCKTVSGDMMERLRPQFIVQERLARRLDAMEANFGLTPMARQQYMSALARGQQLPMDLPPAAPQPESPPPSVPPVIGQRVLN